MDYIEVRVDQASLERVNEISRSPPISSVVHAVISDLSCYPVELATSLEVTKARRRYELSQATHYPEMPDGLRKRVETMLVTTERWDVGNYLPPEDGADTKPNHSWRTLLQAHEAFRR